MNKLAIKALAAASLSLLAIAPAAAQEVRVAIHYGDLDITSAAGAEQLNARLETGIKTACGRPEVRDFKSVTAWTECRDAAMSSAFEQLAQQGAALN